MIIALAACRGDETLTGYGAADRDWHLDTARLTLRFGTGGKVSGHGPCNSFTATQTAPYPWFDLGGFEATEHSCPGRATETALFARLATMTLAEVADNTLILSDDDGNRMVFSTAP